jgi:NAD(P)-dependent dehydrogenase (short-subunit alcohol dehydrogenase family)
MSKSAVAFLSMTLAAEAAPMGIRVNAIAPATVPELHTSTTGV